MSAAKKKQIPEILQDYRTVAGRLAQGARLFFDRKVGKIIDLPNPDSRPLHYPKIGLYYGSGSSHSWTWYVSLLDRLNLCHIDFIDDPDFTKDRLSHLDILLMPGGDTFGMAGALGACGAFALEEYIRNGGLYIGSCAGAYLPLHSSKDPLFHFNFVPVKIKNLAKFLPEPLRMPTKATTPYGCSFIYHPVREEVVLRMCNRPPFYGDGEVSAPLYGGPSLEPSEKAQPLAVYTRFTDKTLFLMDKELSESTMFNNLAALRYPLGQGFLYLLAPHFEHPFYHRANRIMADVIWYDMRVGNSAPAALTTGELVAAGKEGLKELKRQASNARIQAKGLENKSITWLIGHKYYEPEKISAFLEVVWERLPYYFACSKLSAKHHLEEEIELLKKIIEDIREIKQGLSDSIDTTPAATHLFTALKRLNALFLKDYFAMRRADIIELNEK